MTILATYDDFSQGEHGILGAWKAPAGSFTGLNVVRYEDGSIGPRGGLSPLAFTGMPAGDLLALGTGKTAGGTLKCWFVKGGTAYSFDAVASGTLAVATYSGAAFTAPTAGTPTASINKQGVTYWINGTAGTYHKIDHDTAAVSLLTAPTGLVAQAHQISFTQYGVQSVWASSFANRLYWSAPDNPESFPAPNFVDIGDPHLGITGIFVQRSHLIVAKEHAGFNGEWWMITGVLGGDYTVRRIAIGPAPSGPDSCVMTPGGNVVGIANNQQTLPVNFTGSTLSMERALRESINGAFRYATPLWTDDDVVLVSSLNDNTEMRLLYSRDTAWTRHRLELGPSGYSLSKAWVACFPGSDTFIFGTDGRTSFSRWSAYANDPRGGTYGAVFSPASADRCAFTLPEWWSRDDEEVTVSSVTIDFRNFVIAGTNTFTITVTPLRLYEGTDGTPATFTFSEAAPGSDRNQRRQATFLLEHGNGFRIKVDNIRGVAIQKILVHGEPNRAPGDD